MKIGMILDNEFTGDPRVENEVSALRKAGYEVSVLCLTFGSKPIFEIFNGARIIRFKTSKFFFKKIKGLNNTVFNYYPIYWSRKIRNFIKNESITHLHVHDLWMLESALKANHEFKLPIVADIHENFVYALSHYKYSNTFPGNILISQEKWKICEKEWLSKVDKIIVVIEEARERLIQLGIPEEKITVVANYVNISTFTKDDENITDKIKAKNKGYKVITYTGGFDRHRGLDIAIKAISIVKNRIPNIKLQLVGGGMNEDELKEFVNRLQLEDYVDFEGYQPHNHLVSYIKASDICIIPHIKTQHTDNTIPHKLFQYMIMEKPVIASDCNPIKRIVNSTNCGLIYESGNHEMLAQCMINLVGKDHEEYTKSGKKAVLEHFNWEKTSKGLIKLYGDAKQPEISIPD